MTASQQTISPIDGHIVVERPLAAESAVAAALKRAREAQADWKQLSAAQRGAFCTRALEIMLEQKEELGREITLQMGRPIRYTPKEIIGMVDRGTYMIGVAEPALLDVSIAESPEIRRFIRHEPLGVVFAIVPWNYPYLTAVNTVVPALMAGNAVLLKHSPQTPLCAERLTEAFTRAGLPDGLFQHLHLSVDSTQSLIRNPEVDFVAFTGSVAVGREVERAAAGRFIGVGLELGGKDAAYVRADANLEHAVENIVDGAMFNSGQSCCAIERIYVHSDLYDRFVEQAAALTRTYTLGNPLDPNTTLGPMVRTASADFVRAQIADALDHGAKALIDESAFPHSRPNTPYLAPQLLIDVDHSMRVMRDESFGPVAGIMKVESDEEAIRLINDSRYGLTASVWSADPAAALAIGSQLEVGTCFMNRCDYLDPALAWTGVKESGRGCTLSQLGYERLTRPKSYHFITKV